jgi:hypothetical protein
LSNFEYEQTLHDLFGDASPPPAPLLFEPYAFDQGWVYLDSARVETYHARAKELAASVTADAEALDAWLGCSATEAGQDACRSHLFDELLPRIFRRPLSPEDVDDFEAVFARGQELGQGYASGVRAVLEVALQSPEFLYLLEINEPAPERGDVWAKPTAYELASRLSYLYWGSAPDNELLALAASGELSTPERIEAQATRLLDHERSRNVVRDFYAQLFGLQPSPLASQGDYPGFTTDQAELMLQETAQFIDSVTFDSPGDFRTLLTASHSFVDPTLASFYGVEAPTGDGFQPIEFDPARRSGLLTQPSLLAARSYVQETNPTRRGNLIRKRLLCFEVLPEPPTISVLPPVDTPPLTTRERFAAHSQDVVCAACHVLMDPIGFAFGNYDAAGLWQDTENGQLIDASGELVMTDVDGTFIGARELAERLAESDDARRCYVQNWIRYAYRRGEAEQDVCTGPLLEDVFLNSDGNVRELLLALSRTEAFLYRPRTEVTQ